MSDKSSTRLEQLTRENKKLLSYLESCCKSIFEKVRMTDAEEQDLNTWYKSYKERKREFVLNQLNLQIDKIAKEIGETPDYVRQQLMTRYIK